MGNIKKVVVCTARYSDNLGDGVISDSVAYLVKNIDPKIDVAHLDISGRTTYDESRANDKSFSKKIFHFSPRVLRPFITLVGWIFIFRRRLVRQIEHVNLADSSLLIFGGGQLVSDIGLNFPLKISFICNKAKAYKVKYGFNAVGVAKEFSQLSKFLFSRVFESHCCKFITVRDQGSLLNLKLLTPRSDIGFTVDSGLWTPEAYSISVPNKECIRSTLQVGVGVTDPSELASHVLDGHQGEFDYFSFWVSVIQGILDSGHQPILFTNGSRDDYNFLNNLKGFLKEKNLIEKVKFSERFVNPKDLALFISDLDVVISHRLHANIIAHSFSVPAIALAWDQKVKSYYDLIGRPHWCFSDQIPPNEIVSALYAAFNEDIDKEIIEKLREKSKEMLITILKDII